MHSVRRYGSLIAVAVLLVGLSVLTVQWNDEKVKSFVFRWDGLPLRKRQDSTTSYSLPWKSTDDSSVPNIERNAVYPLLSGSTGNIGDVASALLDCSSSIAGNELTQAAGAKSAVAVTATVLKSGVASSLSNVSKSVTDATSISGQVVTAATALITKATGGVSNIGVLPYSALFWLTQTVLPVASTPTSTTEPQEHLPRTGSSNTPRSTSSSSSNATSGPMTMSPGKSIASLIGVLCSATSLPSCLPPVTSTWHGTQYDATIPLSSFMAAYTVTYTETISVCPQSMPYSLGPGPSSQYVYSATSSNSDPSNPCPSVGYPCSECPGGWFCPPSQVQAQGGPCGLGWACGACSGGWYCVPTSVAVSTTASMTSALNGESTMASFTASTSALTRPAIGSSSSISAPVTSSSPAFGRVTSSAAVTSLPRNVFGDVKSVLIYTSRLTRALLSTVLASINSALAAANTPLENVPAIVTTKQLATTPPNEHTASSITATVVSNLNSPMGAAILAVTGAIGNFPVIGSSINNIITQVLAVVPLLLADVQSLAAGLPILSGGRDIHLAGWIRDESTSSVMVCMIIMIIVMVEQVVKTAVEVVADFFFHEDDL